MAGLIADAKKAGLLGLRGHRSVGGIRCCIYSAVSLEDIQKTVDVTGEFRKSAWHAFRQPSEAFDSAIGGLPSFYGGPLNRTA